MHLTNIRPNIRPCNSMSPCVYVYVYVYVYVCIHIQIYDAGLPHPPSPPPPHGIPPRPPVGWGRGLWWCPSPPPLWFRCCGGLCTPTQLRLWLALFAVVPAAGDTAHDVVLKTATRVDNRMIFDIMLNIIIVVVIFIISTIKEQLPPSPSPYNPHN